MSTKSIQGRVDGDLWRDFVQSGESITESLKRLQKEHKAALERTERLKKIDPNPDIALGELLRSHAALNKLLNQSAISAANQPTVEPRKTKKFTAASKW